MRKYQSQFYYIILSCLLLVKKYATTLTPFSACAELYVEILSPPIIGTVTSVSC